VGERSSGTRAWYRVALAIDEAESHARQKLNEVYGEMEGGPNDPNEVD